MVLKCEICGCRISKAVFSSKLTKAGKAKNMGECDTCAEEWKDKLNEMFKDLVIVTDDTIYAGKSKYDVTP